MDSPATHGVCVNVYGRGDRSLGDRPCHVGIAVYELNSRTCEMHHIRCPQDDRYIYDPRTQPLEDSVLRGRYELAHLSASGKERVVRLLEKYGQNEANIPEVGVGNCQDWVAGAVAELESHGILREGEGGYWKNMINLTSDQMKQRCEIDKKNWIDGPGQIPYEGTPDARFSEREERNVGKLSGDLSIHEKLESHLSSKGIRKMANADLEQLYVSSPFFSKTGSNTAGLPLN